MNDVFEFGIEIEFRGVSVDQQGRLCVSDDHELRCAPYFEKVDPSISDETPLAGGYFSHFVVRRFPGHEWNHFVLFVLQRVPIETMRALAYALLVGEETHAPTLDPLDEATARAARKSLQTCMRHYPKILGADRTRRVAEAAAQLIDNRAFVRAPAAPSSDNSNEKQPALDADGTRNALDETYLHLSMTAESFHAFLDIELLKARGENPADYLLPRAANNPLLKRLQAMPLERALQFLELWHRRSYRFSRFTKWFVRTGKRLKLVREPFGQNNS